jgi:predicted nuclease of predicted toxin-antitoxin system
VSLRFLSDQCVPAEIGRLLRQAGHDVIALREVLHPRAPDDLVIAKAQDLGCILLSLNGDFADIVTYPPRNYRGIIAIQLHNHPEILGQIMRRLTTYLQAHPEPQHYRGKLLIVEAHRIRIRA